MEGVLGWSEFGVIVLLAILLLDTQQLRDLFRLFKRIRTSLYKIRYDMEDALQIEGPPMTPDLRQKTLERIRQMSISQREQESEALVQKLRQHPDIANARWVAAFYPTSLEPNIRPWLVELADSGRLLLPRVLSDCRMEFVVVHHLDTDLEVGAFHIQEPRKTLPCAAVEPQVYLVPGIVFGPQGQRLGHGAGYYDRFLAQHPLALRIGIAFSVQCVPEGIPQKSHDIPMNQILCAGTLKNNLNL